MASRRVVSLGDTSLRKVCKKVEVFDAALHALLGDMWETLTCAEGVGLAAPQIAVCHRVCLVKARKEDLELINPIIKKTSTGRAVEYEGCLSIKSENDSNIYKKVERPKWIDVEYQNRFGELEERRLSGFDARIACHEIDHLDGVLYIDKVWEEKE